MGRHMWLEPRDATANRLSRRLPASCLRSWKQTSITSSAARDVAASLFPDATECLPTPGPALMDYHAGHTKQPNEHGNTKATQRERQ